MIVFTDLWAIMYRAPVIVIAKIIAFLFILSVRTSWLTWTKIIGSASLYINDAAEKKVFCLMNN